MAYSKVNMRTAATEHFLVSDSSEKEMFLSIQTSLQISFNYSVINLSSLTGIPNLIRTY